MNRRVAALVGAVALAMTILLAQISTGNRAPAVKQVLTVAGAQSPTTLPVAATTQPDGNVTLPEEFAVLQTHSPFGHGRHAAPGDEDSLVFKGVMQTDERFVAFLEDLSSKQVIQATVGDAISHGRITSVDLDSIEYEATGKSLRVQVGQNLMGQVVAPTPTSQPAAPGPPGNGRPPRPPGPPSPDQTNGQPIPPQAEPTGPAPE